MHTLKKIILLGIFAVAFVSCGERQEDIKITDNFDKVLADLDPQKSENYCNSEILKIFSNATKTCTKKFDTREEFDLCREGYSYLEELAKDDEGCIAKTELGEATLDKYFFTKVNEVFEQILINQGNYEGGRCGDFVSSDMNEIFKEKKLFEESHSGEVLLGLIAKSETRYPRLNCQMKLNNKFIIVSSEKLSELKEWVIYIGGADE